MTYVEVPFEVPLTTVDGVEVLFVGRMDVVGEYLGGYVVVDHKTTGFINSMWTDQWAMDGQNTEVTPTELREAAMCAASNVELYTMKRQVWFTADGEVISRKTGQPWNPLEG